MLQRESNLLLYYICRYFTETRCHVPHVVYKKRNGIYCLAFKFYLHICCIGNHCTLFIVRSSLYEGNLSKVHVLYNVWILSQRQFISKHWTIRFIVIFVYRFSKLKIINQAIKFNEFKRIVLS